MIKSPCIGKCKLSQGKCKGCSRTLQEIADWKDLTDLQKFDIMQRINADKYWPDISFPPINLWVLHPARWNKF